MVPQSVYVKTNTTLLIIKIQAWIKNNNNNKKKERKIS
jgi:hypothetical protein